MLKTSKLLEVLGNTRNYNGNPADKIKAAAEYIAKNMSNDEYDELLLNELVFITKKNIAETLLHQAEENNFKIKDTSLIYGNLPVNINAENNKLSMFMIAPETMLKKEIDFEIEKLGDLNTDNLLYDDKNSNNTEVEKEFRDKKMKEYNRGFYLNAQRLLANKDQAYTLYERQNSGYLNDKFNIIANLDSDKKDYPIEDALNKCQGGFFENLFGTTSNQYKNFKRLFEARTEGKSSREDLKAAAQAYLRHKIPNYAKTGKLSIDDIEAIKSSTGHDRSLLCYKTLKAIEKSEAYERKLANIEQVSLNNLKVNNLENTLNGYRVENGNIDVQNNVINREPLFANAIDENLADNNQINNDNEIDINKLVKNDNEEILFENDNYENDKEL